MSNADKNEPELPKDDANIDEEEEISEEESLEINSILGDTDLVNCTYAKVIIK